MLQSAAIRKKRGAARAGVGAVCDGIPDRHPAGSVNGGLVYGHLGLAAVIVTSAALFAVTPHRAAWRRDTFPLDPVSALCDVVRVGLAVDADSMAPEWCHIHAGYVVQGI